MKRFLSTFVMVLLIAGLVLAGSPATKRVRAASGSMTLDVDGEQVRIVRDEYGVPYIYAATDRALFVGFGYAVAEDRLWQLESFRRSARGELAEIFGPGFFNSDRAVRTVGYTTEELAAMFANLPASMQAQMGAYVEGVNRYIVEEVLADPANKMPLEFLALGIQPGLWATEDVLALLVFMLRNFGEIGGRELQNQDLLSTLIAAYGPDEGYAIFNDVRWLNDPDAPVTVPTKGAAVTPVRKGFKPEQLRGAGVGIEVSLEESKKDWETIGAPTKLGSYAWALSQRRSAHHGAMLYGGPQMGFSVPAILLEVQLTGGESGFDVRGMTFAGVPGVIIGHNRYLAWTSTTGMGDNLDTYVEVLCDAGEGPGSGYLFNGECTAFEARSEVIKVPGEARVITVMRSVHGPVVGFDLAAGVAITQKRAHWLRDWETVAGWFSFGLARNLAEFEAGVDLILTSHNFMYADKAGNIAYWQAGEVPVRPAGYDPRLPLPGTGEAEWPGGVLPTPKSINPARGWLANWNNKASAESANADDTLFGKQFRLLDIEDRLAQNMTQGQLGLTDMEDVPKDIGRVKGLGRESRFLKPYLLEALGAIGTQHPSGPAAQTILQAWDGSAVTDAISSTATEPGEVIFTTWLGLMIQQTFADELGTKAGEASTNMLLHVLDDALGPGSGVPPSRDYFNGQEPQQVMVQVFDAALSALAAQFGTTDPAAWSLPRPTIDYDHPFLPISFGSIPESNRATYAQIVIYGKHDQVLESAMPLGQSGFVSALGVPDTHFGDQMEMFRNFEYKPIPLVEEEP